MNATGNTGKVTNLDYLRRLSKGNDQFVKDMVRIFLEENPGEIITLESAIREGDFRRINACAHKLRSSIPFVGIDKEIAEDITTIETLAREQSGGDVLASHPAKAAFIPSDREMLRKIESLFAHIKQICRKACEELRSIAG